MNKQANSMDPLGLQGADSGDLADDFAGPGLAGLGSVLMVGILLGLAWLAFRSVDVPSSATRATLAASPLPVNEMAIPARVAPAPFIADGPSSDAEDTGTCRLGAGEAPVSSPRDMARPVTVSYGSGPAGAGGSPQEAFRVRALYQESLSGSPDALARAAGLVLSAGPVTGAMGASSPDCASEDRTCGPAPERGAPAAPAIPAVGSDPLPESATQAPATDALTRLALAGSSPQVYGVAWRACAATRDAPVGACQMLSAEQWARLDPDNAVPWLELARLAQERGDAAAEFEAMFRIAKARTVDVWRGGLASAALERAPAGVDAIAAVEVASQLLNFEDGTVLSGLDAVSRHCRADRLADANRHQLCSEVAQTLLLRGRNLSEHAMGLQLGSRLGWPEDRIDAARVEHEAMRQALAEQVPVQSGAMTCKMARQRAELVQSVARLGELSLARRSLSESGRPVSEVARQYRERVAQAQAAAQGPVQSPSPVGVLARQAPPAPLTSAVVLRP